MTCARRARDYRRLLLSLSLLGMLYPLLDPRLGAGQIGKVGWVAAFWLTLYAALRALHVRRMELRIAQTLLVLAVGLGIAALTYGLDDTPESLSQRAIQVGARLVTVAFLVQVTCIAVCHVVARGRVDVDRIWAAVCVYVLIGLAFAYLYGLVAQFLPNTLITTTNAPGLPAAHLDTLHAELYFSFVTLTTLGYGDLLPGNHVSRLLAPTEAMIGQLYLTVLVARLVGLHISHHRVEPAPVEPVDEKAVDQKAAETVR